MISLLSSLLLLGSIILLVDRLILRTKRIVPLPPGPAPAPIIGNAHQVPKEQPWLQYRKWAQEYGPIVHLSMLGQPLIILSTFKAAQELLSKKGAIYSDRPRMVVAGELATRNMHLLLRRYDETYKRKSPASHVDSKID